MPFLNPRSRIDNDDVSKNLADVFLAVERLIDSLISATAQQPIPEPDPPKSKPRESLESREALAIQWLVAFELQSGKLPTVTAVAKAAGINRCVLYSMKRFVAVYQSRKGERDRLMKLGKLPDSSGLRRGFRTEGGGVEAVDHADAFSHSGDAGE